MKTLKRREFILLAGSAAVTFAVVPSLTSCEGASSLSATYSLSESPLPDSLKAEIREYNQTRSNQSQASIDDVINEDFRRFKTVWLGRDLLAYAQFY